MNLKIYLALTAVILAMGYWIIDLKTDLNLYESRVSKLEFHIKENNALIEKLSIETEEYKINAEALRQRLAQKYKSKKPINETCEAKLSRINESLDLFFGS